MYVIYILNLHYLHFSNVTLEHEIACLDMSQTGSCFSCNDFISFKKICLFKNDIYIYINNHLKIILLVFLKDT